jgi:hypothetical protein
MGKYRRLHGKTVVLNPAVIGWLAQEREVEAGRDIPTVQEASKVSGQEETHE